MKSFRLKLVGLVAKNPVTGIKSPAREMEVTVRAETSALAKIQAKAIAKEEGWRQPVEVWHGDNLI